MAGTGNYDKPHSKIIEKTFFSIIFGEIGKVTPEMKFRGLCFSIIFGENGGRTRDEVS